VSSGRVPTPRWSRRRRWAASRPSGYRRGAASGRPDSRVGRMSSQVPAVRRRSCSPFRAKGPVDVCAVPSWIP